MTFEENLFPKGKDDVKRFKEAARGVFSSEQGRLVLSMLCGAAHPLDHRPSLSEHEHGQREVVAALWRFGSPDSVLTT